MYVLLINVFFYFESSSFSNIYYTDYARNANYEVEKYLKNDQFGESDDISSEESSFLEGIDDKMSQDSSASNYH